MSTILVVDDNPVDLEDEASSLEGKYSVKKTRSGASAFDLCAFERPDLILLNAGISDMDSFEFLEIVRINPDLCLVPVILTITGRDAAIEAKAIRSGASDFVTKPIHPAILLYRVNIHLKFSAYREKVSRSVAGMEKAVVEHLAEMIENRDEHTYGHIARVSGYVNTLGRELISKGSYGQELTEESLEMMVRAAPLHDIGKIAISDRYLLKPDRLDDEEFAVMKRHAAIGAEILENMTGRMPTRAYLRYAVMIAASHHERYDGKGYPRRLSGDDIPLGGRIMAVADVYDALVRDRVYRRHFSHDKAYSIILDGKGMQFDPRIVEAFESCHDQFVSMPNFP